MPRRWASGLTLRRALVVGAGAAFGALAAGALALGLGAAMTSLPPLPQHRGNLENEETQANDEPRGVPGSSVRFTDRFGWLLREARAGDGARAQWVALRDVSPEVPKALLAAEDARFYAHHGVDLGALGRALVTSLAQGRVVSGASTLTMQLARTLRPHERSVFGKLQEMALALRLEAHLSKDDVLELYLNEVPFGPNVRGVQAASLYFLGKPVTALSLAEASALAALPRGPSLYAMNRHPDRVLRRRNRILLRLKNAGRVDQETYDRAVAEPLAPYRAGAPFGAPHFIEALRSGQLIDAEILNGAQQVETTLDTHLQQEVQVAAARAVAQLEHRHVGAASVLVVDNTRGEILAYVGSPSFGDPSRSGQNDGVRALRQPGSTLKPFLYGLAMERLGYTPATLLEDVETELPVKTGTYVPRNYDQRYHGPVRLREALGNSLNIPAVRVVERVGVEAFLERLGTLGFAHLKESPDYYGPALALGDGEVTLLELARAYATLARGGIDKPLRVVRRTAGPSGVSTPAEGRPSRVLDEKAAALLEDILMDKVAREGAFGTNSVLDLPFPVAVKTGTSKGYRDNYAVGFTKEVTVAVWVGNFDGSPMVGVSGITGAGPLFRTVMEAAMRHRTPSPMGLPATADHDAFERFDVCALSGQRPTPACPHRLQEWFPRGHGPAHDCMHHERIPVDTRNGLRALPSCPREVVEEKSFERHPGLFFPWSLAAHRPLAPQGLSPLCHGGAGSVSVEEKGPGVARILSPRNGAHFAIDPNRPRSQQALRIQVEASHRDQPVHLRVDGAWLATLTFPYQVAWPLQPGHHVLAIEMAKGNPRSSHDDRDHDRDRDRDETERGTPGPFVARHSIAIDVD